MAQELCAQLGLAVGISSGANFLGAAKVLEEMIAAGGELPTVVTVFPDCNKKYLSTDLCRREPVGEDYLTPRIRLDRFKATRMPAT